MLNILHEEFFPFLVEKKNSMRIEENSMPLTLLPMIVPYARRTPRKVNVCSIKSLPVRKMETDLEKRYGADTIQYLHTLVRSNSALHSTQTLQGHPSKAFPTKDELYTYVLHVAKENDRHWSEIFRSKK
jgi:hypothetical protein